MGNFTFTYHEPALYVGWGLGSRICTSVESSIQSVTSIGTCSPRRKSCSRNPYSWDVQSSKWTEWIEWGTKNERYKQNEQKPHLKKNSIVFFPQRKVRSLAYLLDLMKELITFLKMSAFISIFKNCNLAKLSDSTNRAKVITRG